MDFRDMSPPSMAGPPKALRALGFVAIATVVALSAPDSRAALTRRSPS